MSRLVSINISSASLEECLEYINSRSLSSFVFQIMPPRSPTSNVGSEVHQVLVTFILKFEVWDQYEICRKNNEKLLPFIGRDAFYYLV